MLVDVNVSQHSYTPVSAFDADSELVKLGLSEIIYLLNLGILSKGKTEMLKFADETLGDWSAHNTVFSHANCSLHCNIQLR